MLVALLLDMVQNIALFGNANWAPEIIAVVLVFWGIHQPLRIGIGTAFVFGLLTDVHQSSMLGQHALAFTAQGFFADHVTDTGGSNHGFRNHDTAFA